MLRGVTKDMVHATEETFGPIAPIVVFFIIMQRHIIGGLVAGATKG